MRSNYWLLLNLLSTRSPDLFAKLLSNQAMPSLHCCVRLFHLSCRTLHSTLLNFMRFPWAHFSSPLRSCSSFFNASEQGYPNLAVMGQEPSFETYLYVTVVGTVDQYAVHLPVFRDTLFSSATQLEHSRVSILSLRLPSFLPLQFGWSGEQLWSGCSQEKRLDDLKEGDLVQVCKITSNVDRVNRESLCSLISSTRSRGLQMKLKRVTSERKWLHTPRVVRLWNFLLQDAAGTDILFEFKKGPDRLMEEKLIEDCHVQRWDIYLRKSKAGSQESILKEKNWGNMPEHLLHKQQSPCFSSEKCCSLAEFILYHSLSLQAVAKTVLGNISLRWIWCFSSDSWCLLTLSVLSQHSGILLRSKP